MEAEPYEPRPDPAFHPDFSLQSPGDILIRTGYENTEFYFRRTILAECSIVLHKRLEDNPDLGVKVPFLLNWRGDTAALIFYLLLYISTGKNPPKEYIESDTLVTLAIRDTTTRSMPVIFRLLLHFLKPHRIFLRFAVAASGGLWREAADIAEESLGHSLLDMNDEIREALSGQLGHPWQYLKGLHLRHILSIDRFNDRLDDIKLGDEGECKDCGKGREEVDKELRDGWYRLKTVARILEVWEEVKVECEGCEGCEEGLEKIYGGAVRELKENISNVFGQMPLA